ncbi:hypothetical protein HELRODRAFT_160553 [Helobdella robusta]|uniref:Uncharacterized protein n=1 Tax=Helobdella robusta TaxID=6412 RepID=T1EQE8_HELRO|nr:hypothetical protein HELRODRAFT_160553 [Helobdella robusta]ESO06385.1 hypothetical protein HELRODRAFT_160553 [Helobdella robusta]
MAPTLQQCPVCFNHYRSSGDPLGLDYSGVFDKLTAVLTAGTPEQGNVSAAARLVCSPEGLAENTPETLEKLRRNQQKPSGISVQDGKRPDGCTLTPWRAGKCLAWDVTVSGTLAERYVHLTSKKCGLAAIRASDEKIKKYEHALSSLDFLPIYIKVLGPMDPNTSKFIKTLCKMIGVWSGDNREFFFAINHISCLLQRFLRVCVSENINLNADV